MKHILISNQRRIACYYEKQPAGTPLVLLHGFCEDSSVWEAMLPYLDQQHLIRIDLPGFGGSDLPVVANLEYYARDVHEALQALGIQQCRLIGHSLGGYVALEYARQYSAHLSELGLFHSHPYPDDETRIQNRRRGIEMLQQGKRDLYVAQLFPNLFAPEFAEKHPEIIQKLIKNGQKQSPAGIIAALEAMIARPSYEPVLRHCTCPVRFILGEKDALIPLEDGIRAATMPVVSSLHVLKGVGHMGMWEAPEEATFLSPES